MATIVSNEFKPAKGMIAVFVYEKSGLGHVAIVEYVFDNDSFLISECNYISGKCGIRHLQLDYKNLRGFYALSPITLSK